MKILCHVKDLDATITLKTNIDSKDMQAEKVFKRENGDSVKIEIRLGLESYSENTYCRMYLSFKSKGQRIWRCSTDYDICSIQEINEVKMMLLDKIKQAIITE